jgi:transcriptional regulator with XRE-family HTH domain
MPLTERDILDEIGNIITQNQVRGTQYSSKQTARTIYDSLELPVKLALYIRESRRESLSSFAKLVGISPQSISSILNGRTVSENMLFRLRNGLEYALQHPGISVLKDRPDVFLGDWRRTNGGEIQAAIANVASHLVVLKNSIETSNSLNGLNSPIDKIEIAQLVALLEATLAAIKGPVVNAEQTSGFFRWLRKLGKRGIEKGIEAGVSDAIGKAVDAGSELLESLDDASAISDLGSIIT